MLHNQNTLCMNLENVHKEAHNQLSHNYVGKATQIHSAFAIFVKQHKCTNDVIFFWGGGVGVWVCGGGCGGGGGGGGGGELGSHL